MVAGPGSTSITSGTGSETFFLDTSAGNSTLIGSSVASDALALNQGRGCDGSANVLVNSLGATRAVQLHGCSGFNVQASTAAPGGSTLF